MDDLDWNETATWDRAAEHVGDGLDDPQGRDVGERRTGPLSELIRDFLALSDDHRVAVRIVRANGLPLDSAEARSLAQRPDYPFRQG